MFQIWLTILYGLWNEYTIGYGHRRKSCAFPVGKESAVNVGDPGSIPGLGRSAGEGIKLPTPVFLGFPCGLAVESTCSAGDLGSVPGLGRSPGEGKSYPLQYSGLKNSMG